MPEQYDIITRDVISVCILSRFNSEEERNICCRRGITQCCSNNDRSLQTALLLCLEDIKKRGGSAELTTYDCQYLIQALYQTVYQAEGAVIPVRGPLPPEIEYLEDLWHRRWTRE